MCTMFNLSLLGNHTVSLIKNVALKWNYMDDKMLCCFFSFKQNCRNSDPLWHMNEVSSFGKAFLANKSYVSPFQWTAMFFFPLRLNKSVKCIFCLRSRGELNILVFQKLHAVVDFTKISAFGLKPEWGVTYGRRSETCCFSSCMRTN